MALALLPELKTKIEAATDPLIMALRLAIAGNVIDMGVNGNVTEFDVARIHQSSPWQSLSLEIRADFETPLPRLNASCTWPITRARSPSTACS